MIANDSFTFGDKAAAVHANGYRVVPVAPFDKRPIIKDWPSYQFNPGDEARNRNCGIGILTGLMPNSIRPLDIDVRHPEVNAEIVAQADRIFGVKSRTP